MRILISGASGLVGKALTPILQQRGHHISVLTTRINSNVFSSEINTFHWNPEKGIMDNDALRNVDAIISLAGSKIAQRWTSKAKKSILESRALTSLHVVYQTCERLHENVRVFLKRPTKIILLERFQAKAPQKACSHQKWVRPIRYRDKRYK